MAGAEQDKVVEGRAITYVTQTRVIRVPVRVVPQLSLPRLLTMLLLWSGIPVGLALTPSFPPGDPGAAFFHGWALAGLTTIILNASGLLTIRARRRERVASGDEGA